MPDDPPPKAFRNFWSLARRPILMFVALLDQWCGIENKHVTIHL